ncbi:MAG TPA: hypothetical protein VF614_11835, partial [Chthoniobacteraceae bacterium]
MSQVYPLRWLQTGGLYKGDSLPSSPGAGFPSRSLFAAGSAVLLVWCAMPLAALGETVENGTFAAQLEDWSVQGGVFGDSAVAVLTDQDSRALLHQRVPIEFGEFVLSFDFRNALSTDVPSGTFRDTFFATLYFTDETGAPDIANSPPPDALPLFDLDAGGAYNVHPAARIGSSTKGLGWWS